jgi:hypothetical protein
MRVDLLYCVATATVILIGFSHPKARYFSLLRKSQGCGECRKRRSGFLPKKSIQKKSDPDAACFLRSGIFAGVCQKGLPVPLAKRGFPAAPLRAMPNKNASARRGILEIIVF